MEYYFCTIFDLLGAMIVAGRHATGYLKLLLPKTKSFKRNRKHNYPRHLWTPRMLQRRNPRAYHLKTWWKRHQTVQILVLDIRQREQIGVITVMLNTKTGTIVHLKIL